MKYKLIFMIPLILLIPFVSALDEETVIACGGDDELIIGCLGDEELIFLGNKVPTESGGQQGDGEIYVAEDEEEIEVTEEELPFFSIARFDSFFMSKGLSELDIPILKIVIVICLLCFFWWLFFKRRKKEEEIETKEN